MVVQKIKRVLCALALSLFVVVPAQCSLRRFLGMQAAGPCIAKRFACAAKFNHWRSRSRKRQRVSQRPAPRAANPGIRSLKDVFLVLTGFQTAGITAAEQSVPEMVVNRPADGVPELWRPRSLTLEEFRQRFCEGLKSVRISEVTSNDWMVYVFLVRDCPVYRDFMRILANHGEVTIDNDSSAVSDPEIEQGAEDQFEVIRVTFCCDFERDPIHHGQDPFWCGWLEESSDDGRLAPDFDEKSD